MIQLLSCTYLAIWWQVLLHKSVLIPATENTKMTWHFQYSTYCGHFYHLEKGPSKQPHCHAVAQTDDSTPALLLTLMSFLAAGKPSWHYVLVLYKGVNLMFWCSLSELMVQFEPIHVASTLLEWSKDWNLLISDIQGPIQLVLYFTFRPIGQLHSISISKCP